MTCSLSNSNFLEENFSLSHSIVSSISLHWSLKKPFLSFLAIVWNYTSDGCIFPFLLCLSLIFLSQLFVRPPQTTILPFCISFSWVEPDLPVGVQEPLARVVGWQQPAAGSGALNTTLHAQILLKEVAITFITPTIVWPQAKQQRRNRALFINGKLD